MDILIPIPDFVESSAVFTEDELKYQVRNISRALNALHEVSHLPLLKDPMVKMWKGHEVMLAEYGITLAEEFLSREMATEKSQVVADLNNIEWHMGNATAGEFSMEKPPWFGDLRVHQSHQSELLRINKEHYGQHFHTPENLPRFYPDL